MTLHTLALKHGTDKAFHGYCPFYETYLPEKIKRLLEIGVHKGASLKMWAEYYGGAEIIGADFDSNNLYNDERIKSYPVNQDFKDSLRNLINRLGKFDIIVDDGGHTMLNQQNTLEVMLPFCKYFIMEDLHTSLYTGEKGEGYGVKPNVDTTLDIVRKLPMVKSVKIFEHYHDSDLSITAIIENV